MSSGPLWCKFLIFKWPICVSHDSHGPLWHKFCHLLFVFCRSQIFFYVSMMHFLFAWLLACACVMKVESLKLKVRVFKTRKHLSFFFYLVFNTSSWKCTNSLFWARPHVCMIACMFMCSVCVCVWTQSLLTYKIFVSLGF